MTTGGEIRDSVPFPPTEDPVLKRLDRIIELLEAVIVRGSHSVDVNVVGDVEVRGCVETFER